MDKNVPVKKGQKYDMVIERLGSNGEGIAHVSGFTVFVEGALPGEAIKAEVTTVKKNYAAAKVLDWNNTSSDRVEPKCPIYDKCGGCNLQHISYEAQLDFKRRQVIDAIVHIGGLKDIFVEKTIAAKNPWNYRNKMQFPVGNKNGIIEIGCFARGTHDIITTDECFIQDEVNNKIMQAMHEAINKYHVPVYDEDSHKGILRHVVGRVTLKGEAMVTLVTAKNDLPRAKEIGLFLRKKVPSVISIQQNIQTYHNNVIMGRETKVLWGKQTIMDKIGTLEFHVSPRSFFQVNTEQAEILYDKVREFISLTGNETVIDAYCGTGTIALYLARHARKVYGIEIVSPAISDAKKNARDNNIKNAEFIVGDATKIIPRLYKEGIRADAVVMDPPRAGCTVEVLQAFAAMKPGRIVYVSCNPATLARDMAILDKIGYKAEKVQPVDMFPQTSHVETVSLILPKML